MSAWLTLVSVAVNALAAVFAPLIARKLVQQQERIEKAEESLETVGAGLQVVEQAIEENKDALSRSGPGDQVVKTIREYGPAAKQLVDTARTVAAELRRSALAEYERQVIEREHREHAEREAACQASSCETAQQT